jgi:hypothetical protein
VNGYIEKESSMTIETAIEFAVKSVMADATPEQIREAVYAPFSDMVAVKEPALAA